MDSVAHALHLAEKPRFRASGGSATAAEARNIEGFDFQHGLIKSAGSGRTDTLPLNVPSGSYVLPADIVSGLGQGNTIAGAKILDRVFAGMPYHAEGGAYGSRMPDGAGGSGVPGAPGAFIGGTQDAPQPQNGTGPGAPAGMPPGGYGAKPHMAAGGGDKKAKIIAAGGEYLIHPDIVRFIGGGDMQKGFKWLDGFVRDVRKRTYKTLSSLPGPAHD